MANVHKLAPAEARAALAVLDELYTYYMPEPVPSDDRVVPYLVYPQAA